MALTPVLLLVPWVLLADGGLGPVHGQVGVVLEAGHVGVVVLADAVLLRFWP